MSKNRGIEPSVFGGTLVALIIVGGFISQHWLPVLIGLTVIVVVVVAWKLSQKSGGNDTPE